jgi:hypothetical protein
MEQRKGGPFAGQTYKIAFRGEMKKRQPGLPLSEGSIEL